MYADPGAPILHNAAMATEPTDSASTIATSMCHEGALLHEILGVLESEYGVDGPMYGGASQVHLATIDDFNEYGLRFAIRIFASGPHVLTAAERRLWDRFMRWAPLVGNRYGPRPWTRRS